MKKHVCKVSKSCTCSLVALEPDEDCPIHGAGVWPPRCGIRGRFMKYTPNVDIVKKVSLEILKEIERDTFVKLVSAWLREGNDPCKTLLTDTEKDRLDKSYHASGEVICSHCGKSYYDHPAYEPSGLTNGGYPWLHELCNGDLVKL